VVPAEGGAGVVAEAVDGEVEETPIDTETIAATVPGADLFVFTITDGGYAKRTRVTEYRLQGRGGIGIKAMKMADDRGSLVGALVVSETDEVLCIKASGQVTRSPVADVPAKGRDTMGVIFAGVRGNDTVVAVARNAEVAADVAIGSVDAAESGDTDPSVPIDTTSDSATIESDDVEAPGETGNTAEQEEDSP